MGAKLLDVGWLTHHNLEHCNHPMETLDAICTCLKPGGRLFLAFPSEASVTLHIGRTIGMFQSMFKRSDDMGA